MEEQIHRVFSLVSQHTVEWIFDVMVMHNECLISIGISESLDVDFSSIQESMLLNPLFNVYVLFSVRTRMKLNYFSHF